MPHHPAPSAAGAARCVSEQSCAPEPAGALLTAPRSVPTGRVRCAPFGDEKDEAQGAGVALSPPLKTSGAPDQ